MGLDVEHLVLQIGSHRTAADGLCVMEAVAWFAGEAHTDHPVCASPVIADLLRWVNDAMSETERQRLKPYIPRLATSRASVRVEIRRACLATDYLVRHALPTFYRRLGEAMETIGRLATAVADWAGTLAALPEIVDTNSARAALVALDARDARDARAALVGRAANFALTALTALNALSSLSDLDSDALDPLAARDAVTDLFSLLAAPPSLDANGIDWEGMLALVDRMLEVSEYST